MNSQNRFTDLARCNMTVIYSGKGANLVLLKKLEMK